jgi:hypothetical protein
MNGLRSWVNAKTADLLFKMLTTLIRHPFDCREPVLKGMAQYT